METVPQTVCIRHTFTHKKARYQKLRWSYRGGAPSASPGSATADKWTNGPRQERSRVPGTKVPWNERSRERIVLGGEGLQCLFVSGTNGPGNERFRERMFQRTNSLENESFRERMVPRTKVPSWERMFQGTNSLENEYSSIRCDDCQRRVPVSCVRRQASDPWLTHKCRWVRRRTASRTAAWRRIIGNVKLIFRCSQIFLTAAAISFYEQLMR